MVGIEEEGGTGKVGGEGRGYTDLEASEGRVSASTVKGGEGAVGCEGRGGQWWRVVKGGAGAVRGGERRGGG